jgi:hypothetical protein
MSGAGAMERVGGVRAVDEGGGEGHRAGAGAPRLRAEHGRDTGAAAARGGVGASEPHRAGARRG